jgi:hypothetical protein
VMTQAALEDTRKASFNELEPQMEFLRRMRERMGERYPEAMFLPPVLVNDEEKQKMIKAMRVSRHLPATSVCSVQGWHSLCLADAGVGALWGWSCAGSRPCDQNT